MRIGDLIERVTIQAESRVQDSQGGYTTSWSNIATTPTVSANVRGLSGGEALQAGIQRSVQQWRVVIRRRTDVTPKHRLTWNGLVLDIKAAMPHPDYPRQYTLLVCESGLVA